MVRNKFKYLRSKGVLVFKGVQMSWKYCRHAAARKYCPVGLICLWVLWQAYSVLVWSLIEQASQNEVRIKVKTTKASS